MGDLGVLLSLCSGRVYHRPVKLIRIEVLIKDASSLLHILRNRQALPCHISFVWCLGNVHGLHPFPTLGQFVGYLFTFIEGLEPAACYAGVVHEEVLASIIRGDKTETLLAIEPLDRSLGHVL